MRMAWLALAAALWAGPVGAFTVDLGEEAIERALGIERVRALAVGDRAIVGSYDFCRGEDGSLQLRASAVLTRSSEFGTAIEVTVRPGRAVTVTLREGSRGGGKADVRNVLDVMLSRGRCAMIAAFLGQSADGMVVVSINGRERLSQLLEDLR